MIGFKIVYEARKLGVQVLVLTPLARRPMAHIQKQHCVVILRLQGLQMAYHLEDIHMGSSDILVQLPMPSLQMTRCPESYVRVVVP